jgi:HPt (histidine-containing phosphotransfer) domain-containing protein
MNELRTTQATDLMRCVADAVELARGARCFEDVAQGLVHRLYSEFPRSVVLARCYVTTPLATLPASNAAWVKQLAEAKGIAAELQSTTPIISLVGTAGRKPEWNSRRQSQGHVGIPMVSASFIDAIPMMSRLMASLGGDLSWIDSDDISHVVSQLGTVSGVFYVPDAATEIDARGRKVIPAADFVSEFGVKTVFGVGGAFSSGQIVVLLMFCSEHVPLEIAQQFQQPLLMFKTAAAPLLRHIFADGVATSAGGARSGVDRGRGRGGDPAQQLETLNAMYLKLESELEDRTRSLKIILNSSNDGLILLDLDGTIYGETTAVVEQWFGARPARTVTADYLFGEGSKEARHFQVAFQQVADDSLPFEVAADQMPKRLQHAGRAYSLTYQPILHDQRLVRVLLVIRDVTDQELAAQAEARARELHLIMASALRDRRGFTRFLDDTQATLARIVNAADPVAQQRDLHTVKGNTAVYGFHSFAQLVHRLESETAEGPVLLSPAQCQDLGDSWNAEVAMIADMVDVRFGTTIEVSGPEYDRFVAQLESLPGAGALVETARQWRHDSIGQVMNRLASQARRIASRLGKEVEVEITDHGVRLPLEPTQAFWSSLVHVIRNAVDHGIEAPDRRLAAGKPGCGRVSLDARVGDRELIVTVTDDGAGVDWEAVRSKALAASLACQTQAELTEALFADGLSTRAEVGETSGRGVGLSAVRAACLAIGARIDIDSAQGKGTVVRVALPLQRGSGDPAPAASS